MTVSMQFYNLCRMALKGQPWVPVILELLKRLSSFASCEDDQNSQSYELVFPSPPEKHHWEWLNPLTQGPFQNCRFLRWSSTSLRQLHKGYDTSIYNHSADHKATHSTHSLLNKHCPLPAMYSEHPKGKQIRQTQPKENQVLEGRPDVTILSTTTTQAMLRRQHTLSSKLRGLRGRGSAWKQA